MRPDDELDRLLKSAEEEILPSPGFTRSVMEAVEAEAATPAPVPFPWKRALPGVAAVLFALAYGAIFAFKQFASETTVPPLAIAPAPGLISILTATLWSLGPLLLAYGLVKISMRLMRV